MQVKPSQSMHIYGWYYLKLESRGEFCCSCEITEMTSAAAPLLGARDPPREGAGGNPSMFWSLLSASVNLFISAAGAGLLSYPYAVAQQGIGLNLILSVAFAACNAYTGLILSQSAVSVKRYLRMNTYEEIALRCISMDPKKGSVHAYFWFALSVLIACVGTVIGYLVIVADMGTPALAAWCSSGSSACNVVSSRAFVTFMFAAFIALPLSSSSKMHHMLVGSLLAALSVLVVGALVVTRGAEREEAGTGGAASDPGGVQWFRLNNGLGVILGIPVTIFTFGNHTQIPPIVGELKASQLRKWHYCIAAATVACGILYLNCGVWGYLAFGVNVKGNVLSMFPLSDGFADAGKALMALHIVLAMPVVVLPLRRCFSMLWIVIQLMTDARQARLQVQAARRAAAAGAGVGSNGGSSLSFSSRRGVLEAEAAAGTKSSSATAGCCAGRRGAAVACARTHAVAHTVWFALFGCWPWCMGRRARPSGYQRLAAATGAGAGAGVGAAAGASRQASRAAPEPVPSSEALRSQRAEQLRRAFSSSSESSDASFLPVAGGDASADSTLASDGGYIVAADAAAAVETGRAAESAAAAAAAAGDAAGAAGHMPRPTSGTMISVGLLSVGSAGPVSKDGLDSGSAADNAGFGAKPAAGGARAGLSPRTGDADGEGDGNGDSGDDDDVEPELHLDELTAELETLEHSHRSLFGWRVSSAVYVLAYNAVIILGGAALALVAPGVQTVFGLLGSSLSTSQIYVGPALCLLFAVRRGDLQLRFHAAPSTVKDWRGSMLPGGSAAARRGIAAETSSSLLRLAGSEDAFAAAVPASGAASSDGGAPAPADGRASASSSAASLLSLATVQPQPSEPEWTPWYAPRSAFWAKAHAYALLAIAAFIAVMGTFVNVRELVSS